MTTQVLVESNKERRMNMLYNTLQPKIYIIHENNEWIPPFAAAFKRAGVEFDEIYLVDGAIALDTPPPNGVFWSRLSASSHTRNHTFSKEYGRSLLRWLESYGRCVINGSNVLEFEVSKVAQYLALNKAGFKVPKTIATFSKQDLLQRAKELPTPFITKHNQGGKGLGVRLFENVGNLQEFVESSEFESSCDGIVLLQEYIESKEPFITRLEFIDGAFVYAVRVDTSNGAFELCPADACALEQARPSFAGAACDVGSAQKFRLQEDIDSTHPLVVALEQFLQQHNIQIAGIEFMRNKQDELVVYDINTNTNYNSLVESALVAQGKLSAADRVVQFLHNRLQHIKG